MFLHEHGSFSYYAVRGFPPGCGNHCNASMSNLHENLLKKPRKNDIVVNNF